MRQKRGEDLAIIEQDRDEPEDNARGSGFPKNTNEHDGAENVLAENPEHLN